ncbi:MAG TPA: hypothetical protein VE378_03225 [Nitrososphaeraceae archaeon]|nr:hypothetical protein [Nitrososphaeraceae archaeon]
MASLLYHADNLALMYYSDSVSHLVRARQLVDYPSPSLEQIGTVWLPLPHLLLLPFSLVDLLFRTGLAGTFVSLPSIAITAAVLYKIIKEQMNASWIAFMGAGLYFLNPNILYLGLTAMTEAVFMLFFVVSAFYFQKYLYSMLLPSSQREHSSVKSKNRFTWFCGPNQTLGSNKFIISSNILKCSFFVALATLCRYEAWPIPVFLSLLITLCFLRLRTVVGGFLPLLSNKKQLIGLLLCTVLSFSGIILWISYNWIYYDSPLEFLVSPYYSAAAQALGGQNREYLFLQPLGAASIYGVTALFFFGPVIITGAAFGYIVHRKLAPLVPKEKVQIADMLYLFLAIPSLFNFLTLVFGVGEMNYWWFNSRFLIMLCPLLILLSCTLVKRVTEEKNKSILICTIIAIFFVYPVIVLPLSGEIVTLIDAKNSASYGTRPSATEMAKVLESLYGGGKIFVITGSAQQNIIMQASGIPLVNFQVATEGFNTNYEVQQTALESQYVILSKKPDSSAQRYAESWGKSQDELNKYFDKSYENSDYRLFVRN